MGIDELRSSLKVGEDLGDLVVISKNATSGLLIVSNKREQGASSASGISRPVKAIDAIKAGHTISGRVLSHTPQGTMIQITPAIRGRVHPCDTVDDLSIISSGNGPLIEGNTVKCYVLSSDRSTRLFDLSTRPSRLDPKGAPAIVDPEINAAADIQEGQNIRGLVSNVANHGVFVSLGRNITARIKIRELFDDFVDDWQTKFQVNQLVDGKIIRWVPLSLGRILADTNISIDAKKGMVEMSLRKNREVRGAKGVVKLGLADFAEGQKVVAVVKKVSWPTIICPQLIIDRWNCMGCSSVSRTPKSAVYVTNPRSVLLFCPP
jgi:rRNA biogenesis protein RRP5